jgi:enolase
MKEALRQICKSNHECLQTIMKAIEGAGYQAGEDVLLALGLRCK